MDAWDLVMRALSQYWRVTRQDNLVAQRVQCGEQRPQVDFIPERPEASDHRTSRDRQAIQYVPHQVQPKRRVAAASRRQCHRTGGSFGSDQRRIGEKGVWSRHGRWCIILPRPA